MPADRSAVGRRGPTEVYFFVRRIGFGAGMPSAASCLRVGSSSRNRSSASPPWSSCSSKRSMSLDSLHEKRRVDGVYEHVEDWGRVARQLAHAAERSLLVDFDLTDTQSAVQSTIRALQFQPDKRLALELRRPHPGQFRCARLTSHGRQRYDQRYCLHRASKVIAKTMAGGNWLDACWILLDDGRLHNRLAGIDLTARPSTRTLTSGPPLGAGGGTDGLSHAAETARRATLRLRRKRSEHDRPPRMSGLLARVRTRHPP